MQVAYRADSPATRLRTRRGGRRRCAPGAPTAVVTAPPARPAHLVADAATGASPRHGEGPALVVADKVDGAALRGRHRERIKADRSAVTVLTGGTARELGQQICEASVPKRPPETPKPNFHVPDAFGTLVLEL